VLILGIETSGRKGSVALCRETELVGAVRFPDSARHARDIMRSVDELLREAGVAKAEVQAVAVSQGPGSFTGLRVGVTCAKSLAHLLGWQAVGVPSLDVLVQNVDADARGCTMACPLRDARRSFVYGTLFEWRGGRWADLTGMMAGDPEEVAARIPAGTLVFGSGLKAYPDAFPEPALRRGPDKLAEGEAEHVARLGVERIGQGMAVPPMELLAEYYRRTEAEEKLLDGSATG